MRSRHSFTKRTAATVLGLVLTIATPFAAAFQHPGGIHPQSQIDHAGAQIAAGKEPWASAWSQALDKAQSGLSETPSAVRNFSVPFYYVDSSGHGAAKAVLRNDAEAAYATALAYAVGAGLTMEQRNRYADKAVALLNDWAYTNTSYSNDDAPLVMSYTGPAFAWAAEMIWNYEGWNASDKAQFQNWARDVLGAAGNQIKYKTNNWGTWGILAALAAAHVNDDQERFDGNVRRLKDIIDGQIEDDGSMPRELSRGDRSFHYTDFALEPLTAAMELVRNAGGPNLFDWDPPTGGSVRDALDFMFDKGIENPKLWPGGTQLLKPSPSGKASETMQAMGLVYGVGKWLDWVDPPIYREGTGLAFVAPTLLQPLPRDAAETAPAAPTGVSVEVQR